MNLKIITLIVPLVWGVVIFFNIIGGWKLILIMYSKLVNYQYNNLCNFDHTNLNIPKGWRRIRLGEKFRVDMFEWDEFDKIWKLHTVSNETLVQLSIRHSRRYRRFIIPK